MKENDVVCLKKSDNSVFVKKKIIIPFTRKEITSQHDFINYLYDNDIKVARILKLYKENNHYYEEQEYIKKDYSEIEIEELVIAIALFHSISAEYNNPFYKQNTYNLEFVCNSITRTNLLLGFKEKYYTYPKNNLIKRYNLIYEENKQFVKELEKIYDECYKYFIKNYKKQNCIIHNDLTSNNVIKCNGELYLIDFDLSVKSSVYVDFIDCVIKRYKKVAELLNKFDKNKLNLDYYITLYNQYNKKINIDVIGCYCMIILKILSYNFYISLDEKNILGYNKDIKVIHSFIKKIYKLYKGGTKCK